MKNVLFRLFVANFYKKNSAFFLLLVFVLFGVMSAKETVELHKALMRLATGSGYGVGGFMLACSLFAYKCISYLAGQLKSAENQFLKEMRLVPNARQIVLYAICSLAMYSPIFSYALVTAWVGCTTHNYSNTVVVIAWQLVSVAAIVAYLWHNINSSKTVPLSRTTMPANRQPNSAYTFTLLYLWHAKKGNLLAIKAFSILVFQFLVVLNSGNVKLENFCFVTLLSLSAHALLPYHVVQFWERDLGAVRTFPISLAKKVSFWLVSYMVLMLPELLFMLLNNPDHVPLLTIFSFYCLCITHLVLLTAIQYLPSLTFNTYSGVVFFLFFACMLLLAAFTLWWFIAAEAVLATLFLYTFYPRFEAKPLDAVK